MYFYIKSVRTSLPRIDLPNYTGEQSLPHEHNRGFNAILLKIFKYNSFSAL